MDYLNQLHAKQEWVFSTLNCDIPIFKVSANDDVETIVNKIVLILDIIREKEKEKILNCLCS